MKRFMLLILGSMMLVTLSGCERTNNELYNKLDVDKAEEIALDYMNEKYDENFYVVNSKKDCEQGYVPASVQTFWCDVNLKIKDSDQNNDYTVRVTIDDNTKNYIIQWDTYMTDLIMPFVKRDIDSIVSELGLNEYCIEIYDIWEEYIGGKGFTPDFDLNLNYDTLKSLIKKYDLWICFDLYLPESSYKDSLDVELQRTLKSNYSVEFSDDYIRGAIITFDDDYYSEVKQMLKNNNALPDGYDSNEIHHDVVELS